MFWFRGRFRFGFGFRVGGVVGIAAGALEGLFRLERRFLWRRRREGWHTLDPEAVVVEKPVGIS